MSDIKTRDDIFEQAVQAHDDRSRYYIVQSKRFFILTVVLLFITMGSISFTMWVGIKNQYIPYVVMVDDLGRAELATNIELNTDIPQAVMRREMSNFVIDWRTIPNDLQVLKDNLWRVLSYLDNSSAAYRMVSALGTSAQNGPFALFEESIGISVEVVSVIQSSERTWNVEWIENQSDRNSGRPISTQRFEGAFVIERKGAVSEEILTRNPLGIFITNIDIQRLDG